MDPILFESLGEDPTPPPPSAGGGRVGVFGYGYESLAGGGIGSGRVAVRQNNDPPEPEAPNFGTGTGRIGLAQAYSFGPEMLPSASGSGRVPVSAFGYEGAEFGGGRIAVRAYGQTDGDVSHPPTFAEDSVSIIERLAGAELLDSSETARVSLVLAISQAIATEAEQENSVNEEFTFADALDAIYYILVSHGLSVGDAATASPRTLERVVETLLMEGLAASQAEALSAIVDALAAAAAADALARAEVTELLQIEDVVLDAFTAAQAQIERLSMAAMPVDTGTMVALVSEGVVLGEAFATELEAFEAIRQGVAFALRISIDTGEYVAWAVGTQNKQLSKYTNFPFNSFAKIGGVYLGCTDEGIFRLDGDDDDGDDIHAKLRGAMTDMGSLAMKRNPHAYLAYSAPTGLILRVTSIAEDGEKVMHTYRLKAQPTGGIREGRIKLGEGPRSVMWGWQIENVDGGALELHGLQFLPVVLERKMRGKNGGT